MTTNGKTAVPKKTRVTQKSTGRKAVIPAAEATPDLIQTLQTPPKRRGRPKKVAEPQPVKTTEQIIADLEAQIASLKPVVDLVAQMQHVVDILKGQE